MATMPFVTAQAYPTQPIVRFAPARLRLLRTSAMPPGPLPTAQVRASRVPGPDEDREVAHSAFVNAIGQCHHGPHIKGMQEFAGALLARQRIPSGQYTDPLAHIFDEFDTDQDGKLSAHEVAQALRSRQVEISDDEARMFIGAVDMDGAVTRDEFRELILCMAAADLQTRRAQHEEQNKGEWLMSSWEADEELVSKLKSWTDHLMLRRFK